MTSLHRLQRLEQLDRIVILDTGRLVEQGTPAKLLAACGCYYQATALGVSAPPQAGC